MNIPFLDRFLQRHAQVPEGYNPIDSQVRKAYNRFRPEGAKPFFCYVPFTSLTFSFSGQVFACSYNRRVLLGRYPKNTIRQIWEGEEANKLRNHLRYNDLNYGCEHCKYFVDKGKFSNLKPLVFDKYAKKYQEKFPLVMEFELANTCNLECQMCIGEVSSSIRKNRDKLPPIRSPYGNTFVSQLREFIPYLKEAKFYGGEPFLIPIYFKIWDAIYELKPDMNLFVITNGSTWNENVEKVLYRARFDVAVSIDALDKTKLEKIRKNINLEVLLENIEKFNQYCRKRGTYMSLSFTVQKENWEELPKVIEYCNRLQAHIFVSYLETPVQFSVADMSVEELEHIRRELENYQLPESKSYEKYNKRCFTDFLHYLDTHIANAKTKSYSEYRYAYLDKPETKPAREIKRMDDPVGEWKKRVTEYLKNNKSEEQLPELAEIEKRVDSLRAALPVDKQAFLDILLANEFPQIWVSHMLKNDNEILLEQMQEELKRPIYEVLI